MTRHLATALAALAGLSALAGGVKTWSDLEELHDRWAPVGAGAAEHAAGEKHGFPRATWSFLRRNLRAGDRYYFAVPKGAPLGFIDEATVARTYAGYFLLPAVQVADPADANVIVTYGREGRGRCSLRPVPACVERRDR